MSSSLDVPPQLGCQFDRSAAVLEMQDVAYERWRVTTHEGKDALLERWPQRPDRAQHSLVAGRWLRDRLRVPEVLAHEADTVLVQRPEGLPASVPVQGLHRSIEALGAAVAQLHQLDPAGLEPQLSLDDLLKTARARVERNELTSSSFRPAYRRYSPERLLELTTATFDSVGDGPGELVVTHGRPSLVNLYLLGDHPNGWLRLDGVAVADRHRDLARVAKHLAEQFGGEAAALFYDAYGMVPDVQRLDAYALLDELLP